ncbi:NAD(P)/FAD-dependent oxidoreductase [Candidatus Stoquefichus massiliensis]|uniref:NAD(P)/FAD-dependent oxidoreductase n=1 Tax=Candidatus Stoquefichus massiliensis TaxID=1470350 RepID=UPI000486CD87|nr:FAD-dependent oxidoreductase [Candidatus Stoquefichus massiliensis]
METHDIVIIGGGSAGLAAAYQASQNGCHDILIIEQGVECGGILQQCIHNGFGLHTFKEELSGPGYAQRFIDRVENNPDIDIWLESTVIEMRNDKTLTVVSPKKGYLEIHAKAIILAMGCRERTRGAIDIKGTRPNGIYNAGQAQKFLNLDGYLVGKRVFILGSGDIGLIMARRMTLEGAKVLGVAELMPYSNGLARNIKQCLEDFDIPLYLSHTITKIIGKDNLEKIVISQVDENRQVIPDTEMEFEVDTLLLSVGLIPENKLSEDAGIKLHSQTKGAIVDECYMTSIPGIFACGNVLHVHDLVDFVTSEANKAGYWAVKYIQGQTGDGHLINQIANNGISYVLPQVIHENAQADIECSLRVQAPHKDCQIIIKSGDFQKIVKKRSVAPAEMEKVILRVADLKQIHQDIEWEVREC